MVTKNRLASSALVLAGGLFAAGAFGNADEHDARHDTAMDRTKHSGMAQEQSFDELDEDRDGYISNAEFQTTKAHEQVDIDALDTDDDGRLNRTEFSAFEMMSQDAGSEQRMEGDGTEPRRSTDEPFQASDPTRDPGTRERDQ